MQDVTRFSDISKPKCLEGRVDEMNAVYCGTPGLGQGAIQMHITAIGNHKLTGGVG